MTNKNIAMIGALLLAMMIAVPASFSLFLGDGILIFFLFDLKAIDLLQALGEDRQVGSLDLLNSENQVDERMPATPFQLLPGGFRQAFERFLVQAGNGDSADRD
jgi:hypothetical protein